MIPERVMIFVNEIVRTTAHKALDNLPVDGTMEVVIRERKKQRSPDHNKAMWAGMLKDISEQAFVRGKQYSTEIWHEQLKREFLPDELDDDFEKSVMKDYAKWKELPNGERICIGSTTKLTKYGMSIYMMKCEAYCANELGVRFTARPQQ